VAVTTTKRRTTAAWGAWLLLAAGACGRGPSPEADGLDPRATGRFVASYGPATSEFAEFRERLMAHRFLDTLVLRLNATIAVPADITLGTAHCDEPNAAYEPEHRRVTICYELFRSLSDRFAGEPGEEYLVSGTILFGLMHELGHALVDVLDLPVTGREEDAVDQLATLLILEQGAAGDSLVFGAVGWFATNARSAQLDDLALADDHGLDQQRVYNILCWLYGRDPSRYPMVRSEGWLPAHRAERCPAEYRRVRESWRQLLAPHQGPRPATELALVR
jgi:hypothetical protein